jgi:hypothetical protein
MKETLITLKIRHRKNLPALTTDVLAQRAYAWLYSQGVEVGVTASIVVYPPEPEDEGKDKP